MHARTYHWGHRGQVLGIFNVTPRATTHYSTHLWRANTFDLDILYILPTALHKWMRLLLLYVAVVVTILIAVLAGLWACTSECKILGHSDRCWSPSASRANASSFAKTASLPRDAHRRDNCYQAHIPKTVGLQSVYEKVQHRDYDYVIVSPGQPVMAKGTNESTLPVFSPITSRSPTNNV